MSIAAQLGIELPIIQAPMAGSQNWELAAAVSNAGGLGSIPCALLSPAQAVAEVHAFRAASRQPFNLNFFCHKMPAPDPKELANWQRQLQDYYRELEVTPPADLGTLRQPFNDELADRLEPLAPPIVSFHFGLPAPALVDRVKQWGATVLCSATTVEEGVWLEQHGVDIVIAQGFEAGGHRGMFLNRDLTTQMGLLPLASQLLEQVSVPVVAAGGIASRRDIRALLELGVAGVQIGTSFLRCVESTTSDLHRRALREPHTTTALTNLFSGRPARGIRNRLMNDLGHLHGAAPTFPYASIALAPLRKKAESAASADFTPLWSGQNRSGARDVSAAEQIKRLWYGERPG